MSVLAVYLARLVLVRFALLLVGLTAFLLALDLMANAEAVLSEGDSAFLLARYAVLRASIVASDMIKIAALLAGLLSFATMIRHGELVAAWNAGVSQVGLFRHLLPAALLIGGLQFVIDDIAVPFSVDALKAWGVADYRPGRDGNSRGKITWIHVGDDIVRVPTANIVGSSLSDFAIFQRDPEGTLLARLDVASAQYRNGSWELNDITVTTSGNGARHHEARRDWPIRLNPDSLAHLSSHPRQLSFGQTLRFAGGDGQGTFAPYVYQTWLYEKLSACLVPLLMLLLSAALAQRTQRAGHVELIYLFGAIIGFAFFIFNGVALAMGEVGMLPPLFASLSPVIAFTAVAASVIFWHELKPRPA
ncbi:LptF/LptG family permease [Pelagibius sp. 7325]|uniref:LptF/LptG family permease n=1 Tax=Pelagibius sp. 7325 TaxID=3131994 RepID=UPI0030EC663D